MIGLVIYVDDKIWARYIATEGDTINDCVKQAVIDFAHLIKYNDGDNPPKIIELYRINEKVNTRTLLLEYEFGKDGK